MINYEHWAQKVKNLSAMQETQVWSLGWEDTLEKGMATHSSILAWEIPRTNLESHRVPESDTTEQLTHTHELQMVKSRAEVQKALLWIPVLWLSDFVQTPYHALIFFICSIRMIILTLHLGYCEDLEFIHVKHLEQKHGIQ